MMNTPIGTWKWLNMLELETQRSDLFEMNMRMLNDCSPASAELYQSICMLAYPDGTQYVIRAHQDINIHLHTLRMERMISFEIYKRVDDDKVKAYHVKIHDWQDLLLSNTLQKLRERARA